VPIEPWWETNPATTPRQELGMVSPELLTPGNSLTNTHKDCLTSRLSLDTIPQIESATATWPLTGQRNLGARPPVSSNGPLFLRDRTCAVAEAPGHRGGTAGYP
jgi:hypothetical protein